MSRLQILDSSLYIIYTEGNVIQLIPQNLFRAQLQAKPFRRIIYTQYTIVPKSRALFL